MNLAIRYLKYTIAGGLIGMSFVVISYCILFPGEINTIQIPYYGFHGIIYGAIFLSLLIIVEKTRTNLLTTYRSFSFQGIGVVSALIASIPAVVITIKASPFPLVDELKNILIFMTAQIAVGWFIGMLLGKITRKNA